jgi:hypothetical protein
MSNVTIGASLSVMSSLYAQWDIYTTSSILAVSSFSTLHDVNIRRNLSTLGKAFIGQELYTTSSILATGTFSTLEDVNVRRNVSILGNLYVKGRVQFDNNSISFQDIVASSILTQYNISSMSSLIAGGGLYVTQSTILFGTVSTMSNFNIAGLLSTASTIVAGDSLIVKNTGYFGSSISTPSSIGVGGMLMVGGGVVLQSTLSTFGQAAFFSSVQIQGSLSVMSSIAAACNVFVGNTLITSNLTLYGSTSISTLAVTNTIGFGFNVSSSTLHHGLFSTTGAMNIGGLISTTNALIVGSTINTQFLQVQQTMSVFSNAGFAQDISARSSLFVNMSTVVNGGFWASKSATMADTRYTGPVVMDGTLNVGGTLTVGAGTTQTRLNGQVFIADTATFSNAIRVDSIANPKIQNRLSNDTWMNSLSFHPTAPLTDLINGAPSYGLGFVKSGLTGLGGYSVAANQWPLQIANYYGINLVGGNTGWPPAVGTSHMAIVNGRVGINCNIPAYTLDVAGDINYTGNLKINGANAVFTPAGINSVGNVGINGALNTNYALTVNGAQSNTGTLGVANNITTGTGVFATTEISLGVAAQGFLRFTTLNAASFIQSYNNSGVFQSILFTGATGTSEQMILTATGLGIGTTTPAYKLDVVGNARVSGDTIYLGGNNTSNLIRFSGTSGDGAGTYTTTVIGEYLYGGTESSELILFKANDGGSISGPDRVRVLASGGFQVDINGLSGWNDGSVVPLPSIEAALCVAPNGNVGIGTKTPGAPLQVAKDVPYSALSGGLQPYTYAQFQISQKTTGGRLYLGNAETVNGGAASIIQSATFNNSVDTFTNLLINPLGGNVGIGTTTPGYKLDVNGTTNLNGVITFKTAVSHISDDNTNRLYYTPNGNTLFGSKNGYIFQDNSGASLFTIDNSGNVLATRDVKASRSINSTSDINVGTTGPGFMRLTSLNGATYIQSSSVPIEGPGAGADNFIPIYFTGMAGGSPQMILTATGLGIGTTTPGYKLDVNGTTNLNGEVNFPTNTEIKSRPDNVRRLYFDNTATTYFGSANGYYAFQNSTQQVFTFTIDNVGNVVAKGNVTAYSDVRAKENITTIDSAVDKVMALRGVYYTRKDIPGPRQVGVIAQEVETILPEVVMTDTEGKKSVAYGNIVALLIEAMKEQQEMIRAQKSTIERLLSRI